MIVSEDLINAYKNENLAVEAFKEFRFKTGIVCKKCGYTEHYWLKSKEQFQCKACRFRTTLRSGTVLEGSKLPISYFFLTLYLLIRNGNKVTMEDLKETTEHKYYEPLWSFLRKMKEYLVTTEDSPVFVNFLEVANKCFDQNKFRQPIQPETLVKS